MTESPIPLAVPKNNDRKVPAQVGQAINNPVVAPVLLRPPVFLDIEIAPTARAIFRATRYDTVNCKTRFNGIIFKPICSVR